MPVSATRTTEPTDRRADPLAGAPAEAPRTSGAARSREAMVLVAERLFAERGTEAVSLREIGAAAGQRNNSAAQYHFGSKDGLIEAIFAFRMTAINERRLAEVAALDDAGEGDDLRGLVSAYVRPLAASFDDTEGERWYLRFLARVATDPSYRDHGPGHRAFTAGLDEVLRRLDVALDDLPQPIRRERLLALGAFVVNVLAALESGAHGRAVLDLLTADLVDMAVGLLTAPVSSLTRTRLDALPAR